MVETVGVVAADLRQKVEQDLTSKISLPKAQLQCTHKDTELAVRRVLGPLAGPSILSACNLGIDSVGVGRKGTIQNRLLT